MSSPLFKLIYIHHKMLCSNVKLYKHRSLRFTTTTTCSAAFISCFSVISCSPSEETSRRLTVDEMYLVDSGGQYLWVKTLSAHTLSSFTSQLVHFKWVIMAVVTLRDGTTDITRTVHWGTPTAMQKVTCWISYWEKKRFSFLFRIFLLANTFLCNFWP